MDRPPISYSAYFVYALQAINYLFPLILIPYLARTLGISHFGEYQVAIGISVIGTVVTDWGFNLTSTHAAAKLQNDKSQLSIIASETLSAKLLLFCGFSGLILLFLAVSRNSNYVITIAILTITLSTTLTPTWLYQGLERFKEISLCNAAARVATTALMITAVRSSSDVSTALFITAANGFIISAWLWGRLLFNSNITLQIPSMGAIRRSLKSSFRVFATNAVSSAYTSGAIILVSILGGNTQAGIYAAADRIISTMKNLMGPLVQIAYSRISSYTEISKVEFFNVTRMPFLALTFLMTAASLSLYLFRDFVFVDLMHTPEVAQSAALPLLALTLPILALAHWLVTVGLLARGFHHTWSLVIISGFISGLFYGGMMYALRSEQVLQPQILVSGSVLITEAAVLLVGYYMWGKTWR